MIDDSFFSLYLSAPPRLEREPRDLAVDLGDQIKAKVGFSGRGPFEFKVLRDGRQVHLNDRIKVNAFDDYVVLVVNGMCVLPIYIAICFLVVLKRPRIRLKIAHR